MTNVDSKRPLHYCHFTVFHHERHCLVWNSFFANRRKSVKFKISIFLWQDCAKCWKTYSDRSVTRHFTFTSFNKTWNAGVFCAENCECPSVTMILPELTTNSRKGFMFKALPLFNCVRRSGRHITQWVKLTLCYEIELLPCYVCFYFLRGFCGFLRLVNNKVKC